MRYYEVYMPDKKDPFITTRVRGMKNLPEGTKIWANVTDYDGTLIESWPIPVVNGRPSFKGTEGVRKPKVWYG